MKFSQWWRRGAKGTFVAGKYAFQGRDVGATSSRFHLKMRMVGTTATYLMSGPIMAARTFFKAKSSAVEGVVTDEAPWDVTPPQDIAPKSPWDSGMHAWRRPA